MCPWHGGDPTKPPPEVQERIDREASAYYARVGLKTISKEEFEALHSKPDYEINEGRWRRLPSVTTSDMQQMFEAGEPPAPDPAILALIAQEDNAGAYPADENKVLAN